MSRKTLETLETHEAHEAQDTLGGGHTEIFSPAFVWGYQGRAPAFKAYAAKTEGASPGMWVRECDGSEWMAKAAIPDEQHEVNSSVTARRRPVYRTTIGAAIEKVTADLYASMAYLLRSVYGKQGAFVVPEHILHTMPVDNKFLRQNQLMVAILEAIKQGRGGKALDETVYVVSKKVEGYCNLSELKVAVNDEEVEFMQALKTVSGVPSIALVEGRHVPIVGFMQLLACGKSLADSDVLGGSGTNAGFVVERNAAGEPIRVRIVNIDTGGALNVMEPYNRFTRCFLQGGDVAQENTLKDPRNFQYGNQTRHEIQWLGLTLEQQEEALSTFYLCLKVLPTILSAAMRRPAFNRAVNGKTLLCDELIARYQASLTGHLRRMASEQAYGSELLAFKQSIPFNPRYAFVNRKIAYALAGIKRQFEAPEVELAAAEKAAVSGVTSNLIRGVAMAAPVLLTVGFFGVRMLNKAVDGALDLDEAAAPSGGGHSVVGYMYWGGK